MNSLNDISEVESDTDSIDIEIKNIFSNGIINNEYITNCHCYSLPMFHDYEKYKIFENSDKILIPKHIINNIKDNFEEVKFPLIVTIEKLDKEEIELLQDIGMKKTIICQIYDLLEDEDVDDIYIPFRLMQNLWLNEGDLITLKYSLQTYYTGKKIILKPHSKGILEIENPKIFLEKGLIENYSVLSKEDIIGLSYFENTLYFDVLDTIPSDTILVNTDLEVDFENPLDLDCIYPVLPEKILIDSTNLKEKENISCIHSTKEEDFVAFSGNGYKLGDK